MDLCRDSHFDAQLAGQAVEFKRQQAEKRAAIDGAPAVEPSDTETIFDLCYVLAADRPAILADNMHQVLRKAGYNQSKKAMNTWLREYFEIDTNTKQSQTHVNIKEINQSHKVAWKGFKPKSHLSHTRLLPN
eukprot:5899207-Prymnesium_polylepis.1